MKKALRYLALIVMLGTALLAAGCFGNPGEQLVGTWIGTQGGAEVQISIAQPLHKGFLMLHVNAYQGTVRYYADGAMEPTLERDIQPPTTATLTQLTTLLQDYMDQKDITLDRVKELDPFIAWATMTDFSDDVSANCFAAAAYDEEDEANSFVINGELDGNYLVVDCRFGTDTLTGVQLERMDEER